MYIVKFGFFEDIWYYTRKTYSFSNLRRAAYMQSYGKKSAIDYIICINHTLHLSVLKCLEVYDVGDKDTDKKTLIKKVRSVVHTFKTSPKLQQY